jgi:hypothetical protein
MTSNNEHTNTSSIADILNIRPITDAVLEKIVEDPPTKFTSNTADISDDAATSGQIVKETINRGVDMLGKLKDIACDSQNPRFFEAFTELFKSVVTANKEFLETKQIAKSMNATPIGGESTTVNQHLYLSTADFARLISKAKSEDNGN